MDTVPILFLDLIVMIIIIIMLVNNFQFSIFCTRHAIAQSITSCIPSNRLNKFERKKNRKLKIKNCNPSIGHAFDAHSRFSLEIECIFHFSGREKENLCFFSIYLEKNAFRSFEHMIF